MTLRISNRGWVVIPAELRKKYRLFPGRAVQIVDYGGVLTIVPSFEYPIDQSAGMLAGIYTFQANEGARRFYERQGFKAIQFSDGPQNEEKRPDVLYEWRS